MEQWALGISIFSAIAAFASAEYARRANRIAKEANKISINLEKVGYYRGIVGAVAKDISNSVEYVISRDCYERHNDKIKLGEVDLDEQRLPQDLRDAILEWRQLANDCIETQELFNRVRASFSQDGTRIDILGGEEYDALIRIGRIPEPAVKMLDPEFMPSRKARDEAFNKLTQKGDSLLQIMHEHLH